MNMEINEPAPRAMVDRMNAVNVKLDKTLALLDEVLGILYAGNNVNPVGLMIEGCGRLDSKLDTLIRLMEDNR